jgi:hypothetical protein
MVKSLGPPANASTEPTAQASVELLDHTPFNAPTLDGVADGDQLVPSQCKMIPCGPVEPVV